MPHPRARTGSPVTRRRAITVGAIVLAVAGAGISSVSFAAATPEGPITGIGGKCLDVTDGSSANGTRAQIWTCNGGAAQRWSVGDDNSITALGKCLDVAGAATSDGAKVQIYDCNGTAAQRWTASAGRLVNGGSGKCLDAADRSSADGTKLQIWTCSTGANQQWAVAVPSTTPTTTSPAATTSPTASPSASKTSTPTASPSASKTPTPTASATAAPTGSPCVAGASYGNPLPASSVSATKIKDGYNFLEGPAWDAGTQTLKLTSMRDGAGSENVQPSDILTYTPSTGAFSTFISSSGSNGLAISRDGTALIAATHDQRNVSSYNLSTKTRTIIAADYQGRRFNSPNDVTVAPDGTVYFTDPDFQRANRTDDMGGKTGVFRVKNGVVTLIDDTIRQPNGIELSPDAKTLYVGGNATGRIYRYPVNSDGSTGARSDFASVEGTDGGTVDCAGNVYQVTYGDGKVHVYSPTGQQLGTISAGPNATNVAFGGSGRTTLYITSGKPSSGGNSGNFGLYSVQLNVPGWPY